MRRQTASERFGRIVAVVPWIAERDGPRIDEVCERFDVDRDELLADLDVVFMVGIPPYTPDELIDVVIEDDRVWITLGRYFTRPLRLTASEALGVLAAATGLMAITGADPDGPLARALAKLRGVVGISEPASLDVDLGGADTDVLTLLQSAATGRRTVEIDYYSYSSDEHRVRAVDPYRVYATEGNWYVIGHCHLADAERLFRVDRIAGARETGATFDLPRRLPAPTVFSGSARDRAITLEVGPADRWIAEHYPTDGTEELANGRLRVTLAVGGDAWLGRLLLRLGTDAHVVDPDDPQPHQLTAAQASAIVAPMATRMIEMYRDEPSDR